MAEEFTLSVNVDADLSKFRQTLRAELEAVRQQGATVPVGTTAGASGTNVVPPGAAGATVHPGASPTAQAVAQQMAQASGAAAARVGFAPVAQQQAAFFGTGGMVGPPGAMLPNAGGGWPGGWQAWGQPAGGGAPQPGSPQPTPGTPPVPPPTPPQPGPGPGQGQRYWRGRMFLTGAYIANAAGRLVDASNQYNLAQSLSRGDPGALAMADVQHRHDIADAFPVAGRLALSLNEAATGDEAAIKRTLQDAADQNARTQSMRERGEMAQDFRQQGAIAGARGAQQARLIADYHYESQVYSVKNASRQASEETAAIAQQAKQDAQNKYNRDRGPPEMAAQMEGPAAAARDTAIRAAEQAATDSSEKQKTFFGPMLSAAEAVRQGAYRDIAQAVNVTDIVNRGGAAAARFRGNNQPFEAGVVERQAALLAAVTQADPLNRAGVISRGLEELKEYNRTYNRNLEYDHMRQEGQGRVLSKLLDRQPLAARLQSINEETDEELREADKIPANKRLQAQRDIVHRGGLRLALARQEDTDRSELMRYGLRSDRDVAALRADRRPGEAGATSIFRAGELAAKAMEKHGDTAEARIRREGTYEELRAYREDYRKGFHSEEIQSLSRTALSGPGTSTENPVEVLKSIDQKLQQLVDKMGVPHAGP